MMMEKVSKTINLTEYMNREFNYVPFIPYNERYVGENGVVPTFDNETGKWVVPNWGGFCYNISLNGTVINYLDAVKRYAIVRAQMADGVFLKRYNDNPQSCGENNPDNDGCIFVPCEPNPNVNFVPQLLSDFRKNDVGDYIPIEGCNYVLDEYIVLIEYIPDGWDIYLSISGSTGLNYVKPYLSVPILLTSTFDQVGVLSNYEYTMEDDGEGHLVIVETESSSSGIEPKYVEFDTGTTLESKLDTLRIGDYFFDESSTVALDYVFRHFTGGSSSNGFVPLQDGSTSGSQFLKLIVYSGTTTATTTDTYSGIFHWDGYNWSLSESVIKRTGTTYNISYPYPKNSDCYKIVPTDYEVPDYRHNLDYSSLLPTESGPIGIPTDVQFSDKTLTSSTTLDVKWVEALKRAPNANIMPTDEWIFNLDTSNRDKYYNTVTLADVALRGVNPDTLTVGNYGWVLCRFENGPIFPYRDGQGQMRYSAIVPADYPYKQGIKVNVSQSGDDTYYDIVDTIEESTDSITFTYTVGAGNNNISGITYQETYPYFPLYSGDTIMVDGVSNVRVFYNKIDKEAASSYVYSEDFNLSRKANLSTSQSFMANSEWSEYGEGITIPTFKDDSYIGLDFAPTASIEVEVNRGNATAFEKHFKLMECQNFSELENYGNNFFNL